MEKKYKKYLNFEYENVIDDDFDPEAFKKFLEDNPRIKRYAFIIHDKDTNPETGQRARRHIHCMCELNQSTTLNKIAEIMKCEPQCIEKIKANWGRAIAYLTHLLEPNKFQYKDEDVYCNFDFVAVRQKALNKKIQKEMLNKLIYSISEGEVAQCDIFNIAESHGIDRNYLIQNIPLIEKAIKAFDLCATKDIERQIETIYIHGASGVGKTTLAKKLANERRLTVFISGSSNDILDGYNGEGCIIIDDVRSSTFQNYTDALKLLDPYTRSRFKSRYRNKDIKANLIILTSTKELDEVFDDFSEEFKQIDRRIPVEIYITKSKITLKDKTSGETILYDNHLLDEFKKIDTEQKTDTSWITNTLSDIENPSITLTRKKASPFQNPKTTHRPFTSPTHSP